MPRFFNTAGVCEPRKHYMLPPEQRLPGLAPLIDQEGYFVVHAPRQSGKSTCFHHLARELTAEGRYAAQLVSCETARTVGDDIDSGVDVILQAIETEAGRDLPQDLRPPPADSVHQVKAQMRLNVYLGSWSPGRSPRKVRREPRCRSLDIHRRPTAYSMPETVFQQSVYSPLIAIPPVAAIWRDFL